MLTFGYQSYSQITSCSFNLFERDRRIYTPTFTSCERERRINRELFWEEKWPSIDCLRMHDHSQKNLESVYIWKLLF